MLLFSGCSPSIVRSDITDIKSNNKSVTEIIKLLINKNYRCNNVKPTQSEVKYFDKSDHKIIKYTCIKQTDSFFCVDNHFIYIYQDEGAREPLLLKGNTSPVCIWTK